jgi:hypothetical protein
MRVVVSGRVVQVEVGGGVSRCGDKGISAVVAAAPCTGAAGGGQTSASTLLLSSRLLALLARSRLLLPECGAWLATSAAESPPFAARRNQRETSSEAPSVSRTNLAATPSLLQRAHAKY